MKSGFLTGGCGIDIATGIEIHPWDIAEDGLEQTLVQIASLGVKRLCLTATWPGRAVLRPRALSARLFFPERGAVYFRPDESRWEDASLRPKQAEIVLIEDYFETLPVRAREQGLSVEARVVFLPHVPPAAVGPRRASDLSVRPFSAERLYVRNAFGDRLPGYFCPARDEARRYLIDLVCDVARYDVSAVVLEQYGFPLFNLAGMPGAGILAASPVAQFLMGVCFCDSCVARGEAMNIEISPLAWRVRNFLERVLSGEAGPTPPLTETPDGLAEIDELLPAYLRARNDIVGTLVRDLRAELRPELRLVAFPGSRFPAAQAWREGGEVARLAAGADVIRLHGGAPDAAGLVRDLTQAQERAAGRAELGLRLTPGAPNTASFKAFAEKVAVARDMKMESVTFAGLGELTHAHLKWIPRSLGV